MASPELFLAHFVIGLEQEVPWSPVDLEACRQSMSAEERAVDPDFWSDELPRPLIANVGPGEVLSTLVAIRF